MRASFVYHQITAVMSVIGTLLLLYYAIRNYKTLTSSKIGLSLVVLSISWGIHSVLHFLEEYMFDFEPISGSTKVRNRPIRV